MIGPRNPSLLITGGTGSFGRALVEHMLRFDRFFERIIVFSRGEHAQADMARQFAALDTRNRLRFFIGDVRDRERLRRAMERVTDVIHAAALKRIEVGAYNPIEMFKTNVDGAVNVVEASLDAKVERVVALSTDKAWQPVSAYGISKAAAECIYLHGYQDCRISVCRYGNVWKSAGSVVPTWQEAIAKGGPVKITDPECTRFFMTMKEAVEFVLDTLKRSPGRELRIPELPAYRLGDLLSAVSAGTGPCPVEYTGLPAWEKLHEGMADGMTSDMARRMSIEELRAAL
jgi:UDP-N-acetylglucosamine 4,6-dehydratase